LSFAPAWAQLPPLLEKILTVKSHLLSRKPLTSCYYYYYYIINWRSCSVYVWGCIWAEGCGCCHFSGRNPYLVRDSR
jgi:hypothetical protein